MSEFWMNFAEYRAGQSPGHKAILDMLLVKIVSIVIPTRYGKSDVIRCSFLDAFYRGYVSCAVILSPASNLQRQIINPGKITEMMLRYSVRLPDKDKLGLFSPTASGVQAFTQWKNYVHSHIVNGPCIISTTHQFAVLHGLGSNQWLTQWVSYVIQATGKPPVFYIDECHLGSDANRTGELARTLHQAGACVVVLTATPYREDGERIPGFDYELVEYDTILHTVMQYTDIPETILIQLRETLKGTYRMVADHEYSWKEAWAERPSPLCDIDLVKVDVTQAQLKGDVELGEAMKISELSKGQASKILGKVVRNRRVQRYCVEVAIERLRLLKVTDPATAAIIFVGNDTEDEENHEAKRVQGLIKDYDSSIATVIATSTTEGADKTITDFVNGKGDVLIVKMMAGLGLDCARLKVGVDLSPVRTAASYAQRLMRIATQHPRHKVATWITPADPAAIELFTMLVTASGGRHEEAMSSQVLEEWLKTKTPGPEPENIGIRVTNIQTGDVVNNEQVIGKQEYWSSWMAFVSSVPEITGQVSQAKLMHAFERAQLGQSSQSQHENTTDKIARLRRQISSSSKEYANTRLKASGRRYQGSDDPYYKEQMTFVWTEMRSALNLRNWDINTDTNEGTFERVLEWFDSHAEAAIV